MNNTNFQEDDVAFLKKPFAQELKYKVNMESDATHIYPHKAQANWWSYACSNELFLSTYTQKKTKRTMYIYIY